MSKIETLEAGADLVISAITKENFDRSEVTPELYFNAYQIPIRDAVLRYAYDNAGQRELIAENILKFLGEVGHPAFYTISAGVLWLNGEQNRQRVRDLLDKALEEDSTYSLARLLDVALTHGIPPRVWADSLANVTREQCLAGAE